jgi:hypothetical protein
MKAVFPPIIGQVRSVTREKAGHAGDDHERGAGRPRPRPQFFKFGGSEIGIRVLANAKRAMI